MSLALTVIATYYAQSDFIEASALFGDHETLHPELVTEGSFHLLSGGQRIDELEFDARNGNADGSFKFWFMHPITLAGLDCAVKLSTRNDDYRASAKVVTDETTTHLAPNTTDPSTIGELSEPID